MTNQEQSNIVRAIPVEPTIQVVSGQVIPGHVVSGPGNEPSINVKKTYAYSRSVKLFAAIEAFFLLLYGFYQPWLFIQAIGPILGYFGAKHFNKLLKEAVEKMQRDLT